MTHNFTEEELRLLIGDAVQEKSQLTLDDLVEQLLPTDSPNMPNVLESFISTEFYTQSKNLSRVLAKSFIATKLKMGSSEFIRKFISAKNENELINIFPADLSIRLEVLKKANKLGSLLVECTRTFNKLREKFLPSQNEEKLRVFLTEWFQSGLMPLSIWKTFEIWRLKNPTLANLRNIKEPEAALKDVKWHEFKRLLGKIKTDNFVEISKIHTILDIFFLPPELTVKDGTVKLFGRVIYLGEWLSRIQDSIKSERITEIAVYAQDNLAIDCDLTDRVWRGKNLVLVSHTVNVWKENAKICLSGESFMPCHRKATSASTTQYRGADGRHGRAGESSGNLAILATNMLNSTRLTVELNGGRGEDGEDGGDGCDGKDGKGVEKNDLDTLILKYYSLYADAWKNFDNYSPPSNWSKKSGSSSSGEYIYRLYADEHGRQMTYSFAGDKGWTYTTYELFFLLRGSNGTSGTSGGSNGVGGQGGYNGTCIVKNPETNEEFQINWVIESENNGPNGKNGELGKSGKYGKNGNDMALIDRSAQEPSKHYEGSVEKKLDWNFIYKAEYKSRLDGFKRYSEKDNACFIKFKYGETIDTVEKRASKAQAQTVRQTSSEAVTKQSIVVSKILEETETLFGKQSSFLADACKASATKASIGEDAAEDEEEANENVTEEVVILRQKEETKDFPKYASENDKKVKKNLKKLKLIIFNFLVLFLKRQDI